jgi:hypothetical protein
MEQVFGAKDEEPRSSPRSNTVHLSQPPPEHMDVDVRAREESAAEGQHSEHTHGETPVPIVVVEPHLVQTPTLCHFDGQWRARFI